MFKILVMICLSKIMVLAVALVAGHTISCDRSENLTRSNSSANNKQQIGGPCEGCEAIYEYGDKELSPIDTLPKFEETHPQLKLYGTVYRDNGRSPAKDVILYIYHTNRKGIYETRGDEKGWARRHGYIRGWIRTDDSGKYAFYTFRPAAYPSRGEPEHIHLTVLEPGKNPYYLDDFLFKDDELLTDQKRRSAEERGGNGIFLPKEEKGMLLVQRDIFLGRNIPNYN